MPADRPRSAAAPNAATHRNLTASAAGPALFGRAGLDSRAAAARAAGAARSPDPAAAALDSRARVRAAGSLAAWAGMWPSSFDRGIGSAAAHRPRAAADPAARAHSPAVVVQVLDPIAVDPYAAALADFAAEDTAVDLAPVDPAATHELSAIAIAALIADSLADEAAHAPAPPPPPASHPGPIAASATAPGPIAIAAASASIRRADRRRSRTPRPSLHVAPPPPSAPRPPHRREPLSPRLPLVVLCLVASVLCGLLALAAHASAHGA